MMQRRRFFQLAAATIALPAISKIETARAQAYPARPVRIIVGYPPGGAADIIGRLMAQSLSERLGQQFVVENRPGAGSNIAAEMTVRAPADGHTLFISGVANALAASLYDKLSFNFIRDLSPVASLARAPNVMEVLPSFPAKTVPEFIAYAKANPGKINMASAGSGGLTHVAGELFKMMTGVNMVHVPYRGGALALTDLLGGQVQVIFDNIPTSIEHIKAGRLRALAVTSAERLDLLPGVPTIGEFVPGYEASGWYGINAPAQTPVEIVTKLNAETNAILAEPKTEARLADLGSVPMIGTPAAFGKFIAEETDKWTKVVHFASIKAG